jgi:NAD(P)-dependent dehydrogenase (short-subunit alcohol dehydrogenase family)
LYIFLNAPKRPIGRAFRLRERHMGDRSRVWFITGVSSGFGRQLAKEVLARGEIVAGTLRQQAQVKEFRALAPGRSFAYGLDVTAAAVIPEIIGTVMRDLGRIDVLVNNAGYGLIGAAEETSDAETRKLFETNFFGLLNVTKAVVPHMRAAKRGHIVNFSSLAGIMGFPGVSLYCATKFAVEGLSEALAGELAAFGIKVTIVEPGGFRTDFQGRSIAMPAKVLPEYADTPAAKARAMSAQYDGHQPGDPAKAAKAIVEAVDSETPPLRLVLGADALGAGRAKLASLAQNYDAWERVSMGTHVG